MCTKSPRNFLLPASSLLQRTGEVQCTSALRNAMELILIVKQNPRNISKITDFFRKHDYRFLTFCWHQRLEYCFKVEA